LADTPLNSDILRTLVACERDDNGVPLKKTTVMVDEDDLNAVKEAAAREGRPVAEYFREAFHFAALRARRWSDDWDIPEFRFGGPVSDEDITEATALDRRDFRAIRPLTNHVTFRLLPDDRRCCHWNPTTHRQPAA
jgi:hypothetical protein